MIISIINLLNLRAMWVDFFLKINGWALIIHIYDDDDVYYIFRWKEMKMITYDTNHTLRTYINIIKHMIILLYFCFFVFVLI